MSTTTTQTQQATAFNVKDDAPIEIPRGTVETSLIFYGPPADGSAPFNYVEKPPQGQPQRNYTEDTHNVTIHDIRSDGETDFIVMELVIGQTLDTVIPPGGMRVDHLLRLAVQMADALAAAHASGIVHRDLKPSNVIVLPATD